MNRDPDRSSGSETRFLSGLDRARRRWWWRRLAEAGVLALAAALLLVGLALAHMIGQRFEAAAVTTARSLLYWALPLTLLALLLPALIRYLSRRQAADYLERHRPGLDALLVSAVEAQARLEPAPASPGSLAGALFERAARALDGAAAVNTLERPRLRRAALGATGLAVLALGLAGWGGPPVQHGLSMLLDPRSDPAAGNPFRLSVAPGDVTLVDGQDLPVAATARGFSPAAVELWVRAAGAERWQRLPMTAVEGHGRFETLLFDIDSAREYFVRSGPIESSRHRIEVMPRPRVQRIDLRYQFPAATGRAPLRVTDAGPIRAVRGTRVEIRAYPDRPVPAGELVLDGALRLPMTVDADALRVEIELQSDGVYRIELPAGAAGPTAASAEFAIQVFDDALPRVALERPGRDLRVSPIEEVELRFGAEDDVAVNRLELVLNINGQDEQVLGFEPDPGEPTRIQGRHALAL